jgi:glycosyltransferase domain-containing protein
MKEELTILIPTHNRHPYLERVLDYYGESGLPVIVADSSPAAVRTVRQNVHYMHLPGINLPAKLDQALQNVRTPYAVMCADDDFLVVDGVAACLEFLHAHDDYVAAQGNSINYRIEGARIDFRRMYPESSLEIGMEDPLERLDRMFAAYKSFFYAVYRTANLKASFNRLGEVAGNLYLNEYVTGIIPLVAGKYIELPVFYQVREYSESSDDKRTPNLDRIFYEDQYRQEREAWLDFLASAVSGITGLGKARSREKLSILLQGFAGRLRSASGVGRRSMKKQIGGLVASIPLIGGHLVRANRRKEIARQLSTVIKTPADRRNLDCVASFIKKYDHVVH